MDLTGNQKNKLQNKCRDIAACIRNGDDDLGSALYGLIETALQVGYEQAMQHTHEQLPTMFIAGRRTWTGPAVPATLGKEG